MWTRTVNGIQFLEVVFTIQGLPIIKTFKP